LGVVQVVVEYRELARCSEEVVLLKALWDMVAVVMHTIDSWRQTLWDKIDTDCLMDEAKKLAKELKVHPAARKHGKAGKKSPRMSSPEGSASFFSVQFS
jgi:hypothetical protein